MDLGVSGLASGFDWRSVVDQLTEVERSPQTLLRTEQANIQKRNTAYGTIQSQLSTLMSKATALKEASLFDSRSAESSGATIATGTATNKAALGAYKFTVTQLATSSSFRGTADMGSSLSATNDVSGVTLDSSGLSSAVTAGSFTVNGKRVTVATTDTLQQVFDNISSATGGNVTASYDASSDKITLTAGGGAKVVLGSANDSSNFLNVVRLSNNDTGTVTSSTRLGAVKTNSSLITSNLRTAVSDGGSGSGKFKVNGVEISFNASTDSLHDVLTRINDSSAGVTASYDTINDRFSLTNKVTGDLGVAIEDVTGNFLAATGISAGTLERGNDLLYRLNDGTDLLTSKSNTIDETSSGVPGLTVSVLATGTATIDVKSDSTKIKTAIKDFVAEYNKSQTTLDTYTATSTDEKGKVTAGVLAGDRDAFELSSTLRSLVNGQVSGLSSSVDFLADLGYSSNGTDNLLSLSDETDLDDALLNNLSGVKEFLSKTTTGMATRLHEFLNRTADEDGVIDDKQKVLGAQSTSIDNQIAIMERQVLATRAAMITSFLAMEQAQAKSNQQLQFINQKFGVS